MKYNVFATIKHSDGQIEPRRLWLQDLEEAEAQRLADIAQRHNACVIRAWAEPGVQTEEGGSDETE